jgi:hypothetical protein
MYVAWKVLLPISLVLVLAIGALSLVPATADGFGGVDHAAGWIVTAGLALYLGVLFIKARLWQARRIREMAA